MVAEIVRFPSGSLMPHLYAVRENGEIDDPLTQTLMDFVMQCDDSLSKIEELIALHQANQYEPEHPQLPDWGVNDINLWLRSPMAQSGYVCISNENTNYHSDEDGQPEQFTYEQFHAAVKHWREFQALIAQEGMDRLVGKRLEAPWPQSM